MLPMQERVDERRRKMTLNKVHLHAPEHNSFHISLSLKDSWELLAKLSEEAWIEKTGTIPSSRVDKNICRFISLEEKS